MGIEFVTGRFSQNVCSRARRFLADQGVQDADVPWQHAVELTSRFAQDDVVLTLVKDGDHRLSRPEDIERLVAAVAELQS